MLWPFVTIAIIGFFVWLPRRAKWENCENLKENAKIVSVHSEREGFGSGTIIRTYVTFDDGFIYSSGKVYGGVGIQFVTDGIREEIIEDAITKHYKIMCKNKQIKPEHPPKIYQKSGSTPTIKPTYSCTKIDVFDKVSYGTCAVCKKNNANLSYCKIKSSVGTRTINICDECINKFKEAIDNSD